MKIFHGFSTIFLTLLIFTMNVEGRYLFHKNQNKGSSSLNSVSSCVFDVKTYGAIGNGSTDDTPAFVAAWKAACAVESATLLVPFGFTFMITSTLFSGPCKPGLVFQVRKFYI